MKESKTEEAKSSAQVNSECEKRRKKQNGRNKHAILTSKYHKSLERGAPPSLETRHSGHMAVTATRVSDATIPS